MSKRPVIDLTRDLPHRAHALSGYAVAKVFGGIQGTCVETCGPYKGTCCSALPCNRQSNGQWKCSDMAAY